MKQSINPLGSAEDLQRYWVLPAKLTLHVQKKLPVFKINLTWPVRSGCVLVHLFRTEKLSLVKIKIKNIKKKEKRLIFFFQEREMTWHYSLLHPVSWIGFEHPVNWTGSPQDETFVHTGQSFSMTLTLSLPWGHCIMSLTELFPFTHVTNVAWQSIWVPLFCGLSPRGTTVLILIFLVC